MKIKRFYFYIGGYHGSSYAIEYRDTTFTYNSTLDGNLEFDDLELIANNLNSTNQVIKAHSDAFNSKIILESREVLKFKKYLERYCKDWKRKYSKGLICDGTYWKVDIWIDNFRFQSQGHEAYPSNFKSFTKKLSMITGGKVFR